MAYAEDLPYWKTGKRSPDGWLEMAAREIDRAGGEVLSEGFGRDQNKAAYLLRFSLDGGTFRVVWPVLQSRYEGQQAAERRQAATMLYHDIKASCVKARALGARIAFFAHLELPDGSVACEHSDADVPRFPELSAQPLLEGEVLDD